MLNRVILMGRLTADPELKKNKLRHFGHFFFRLLWTEITARARTVRQTSSTVLHGVRLRNLSADIFPKAD